MQRHENCSAISPAPTLATESWRMVWRKGVAPLLPTKGLEALAAALENDSPQLIQGGTTCPPPLNSCKDWPPEGACGIGYCGWQGRDLETVGQVDEFFADVCFQAGLNAGEPAFARWWTNAWDETPRKELIAMMLPEVRRTLEMRRLPLLGEDDVKVRIAS